MILLILESHGALHLGRGVNEFTEWVQWQRMIVAAGIDKLELASFVKAPFGVSPGEKEAFDLVCRVECVALLSKEFVRVRLQYATQITGVGFAVLINDGAEDDYFSRAENVGGYPIEGAPVDSQAKVAFFLCGEASN